MVYGDKLVTQSPPDHLLQNRDYNGWTKDVKRNLVLVWDPFGRIVDAAANMPGCFHDSKSTKWGNIYDHVRRIPDGYKCCCDDAFSTLGDLANKLVKTSDNAGGGDRSERDAQLTHLRQASEWGNNILTGVFRRLRTKLPTDNVKRARIMWSAIFLHNFRTETVGRNQIRTYFDQINNDN